MCGARTQQARRHRNALEPRHIFATQIRRSRTMTSTPREVFPVFVGSGRSGTTLLRTIFDAHSSLAVANEPQFMGTAARQRKRLEADGFDTAGFLRSVFGNANFRRLDLDQDVVEATVIAAEPRAGADAVRTVFAVFAADQGKPLYGDKTPGYVVQIPELASMFPEARFVHLIRDGRDVALSYLERPWGPDSVGEAALYWRSRVTRGRAAGRAIGTRRYLEARYENLVENPEQEVQRICSFLGLVFEPAMLHYEKAAERFIASSHQPEAFTALVRPPTSGLRDWSSEMSAHDKDLFEAIAGDLLDDLGYTRANPSVPTKARLEARFEEAKWATKRIRAAIKSRIRR